MTTLQNRTALVTGASTGIGRATEMSNFTKTETGREIALGMQALKRIEDIADVVAFLASEGARWITGASIPVDGGSKL
jgi:3-oxoacyl-[acyl-carrier protein] reductase